MTATHPLWRPFDPPDEEAIAAVRLPSWQPEQITVVDPDPAWPAEFERVRALVEEALGDDALDVVHVGSTSVPGLAAKDVIDAELTVADSADEDAYVPRLEAAGFQLRIREPDWEEHRLLRHHDPRTNLHVFSAGAVEPQRTTAFRDWLRGHPDDRDAYAAHKRQVATQGFTDGMLYNNAKAAFVYDLYEKIFAADPRHPHDPHPRG